MDIHKHLLAKFFDGDIAAYLDLAISINSGLQKAWPICFYLQQCTSSAYKTRKPTYL